MMRTPFLLLVTLAIPVMAQSRHEVALTVGGLLPLSRGGGSSLFGAELESGAGAAYQVNYAVRLLTRDNLALYLEGHFLASPERRVTSNVPTVIRAYSSYYIMPGFRTKFMPESRVSPWMAFGGGWAVHERSALDQSGQPATAQPSNSGSAFHIGGGVDFALTRLLVLRAEVRDFYAAGPWYGLIVVPGQQHNVVVSGGVVFRLGDW